MLAIVVLVEQELRHADIRTRELQCMVIHLGDDLEDLGILNGLLGARAPGERAVLLDEDGRHSIRVDAVLLERADDDLARVLFVGFFDLLLRQCICHGDIAVERVGMRRAECFDRHTSLSERDGPLGMRVDDGLDVRECLVEHEVCHRIARRVHLALDDMALEIDDDHIGRLEVLIRHARRLDDEEVLLAVDARDIAPGERDDAELRQHHVGFIDFLLEFF